MVNTKEGGFFIVGSSTNSLTQDRDILAIKLTAEGTVEWVGLYGVAADDRGLGVFQLGDGGYVITGHSHSGGANSPNSSFALKLTSGGVKIWAKLIKSQNAASLSQSVIEDNEHVYLAGMSQGFGISNSQDIAVIKLTLGG